MGQIHETLARLPEKAFVWVDSRQEIGVVQLGQHGYVPYQMGQHTIPQLRALNEELGVTPAQSEAMLIGSMFGWNVPAVKAALDG